MRHKYELIVGNIGTIPYTNIKTAKKDYKQYVAQSQAKGTRAYNEPVTLLKDGEEIEGYTPNLVIAMFDMDNVKKMIANCPKDEIVILCSHWPINKPQYPDSFDPESEQFDLDELEEKIGATIYVTDYNDLIADPHGIYDR